MINEQDKQRIEEYNLPAAVIFNLQQIALADDEMVKQAGAAERYRFIARHILELFKNNPSELERSEKLLQEYRAIDKAKSLLHQPNRAI